MVDAAALVEGRPPTPQRQSRHTSFGEQPAELTADEFRKEEIDKAQKAAAAPEPSHSEIFHGIGKGKAGSKRKSKSKANKKFKSKEIVESDDDLDTDEEEQVQTLVEDDVAMRQAEAAAEQATQSQEAAPEFESLKKVKTAAKSAKAAAHVKEVAAAKSTEVAPPPSESSDGMEITGQSAATDEQKARYTARMSTGAALTTRTRQLMKAAGKKAKIAEEIDETIEAAPILETPKTS